LDAGLLASGQGVAAVLEQAEGDTNGFGLAALLLQQPHCFGIEPQQKAWIGRHLGLQEPSIRGSKPAPGAADAQRAAGRAVEELVAGDHGEDFGASRG